MDISKLTEEQINAIAEQARYELCKRNYAEYCKLVHHDKWILGKHLELICKEVDKVIKGYRSNLKRKRNIMIISLPPQHGKLCSDDTPVLTPQGFVRHGDIKIGDYVYGRNGEPIKVLDILNEGDFANYEVEFTDGEKIKVHENHEWTVYDRSKNKEVTLETKQIMAANYFYKDGNKERCRFQVDCNKLISFEHKNLPIEPYFLGLWLGDETTTKCAITHHKDDIASIHKCIELGYEVTSEQIHKDTGVHTTYFYGETYQKMKSLGFAFCEGNKKHIPLIYKLSDKEQRLELLAGLIDSDGYVYKRNGRVTFSNVNKELINDVKDVCISLGFRTTITEYKAIESTSGIKGRQIVYQLCFNPDIEIPVALERKKSNKINPMKRKRGIKAIRPIEPQRGKCLTVEGGIYLVGKNLIPTHNSQCISETLPSYFLGMYPNKRVIEVSYGDDLARRFGRLNKLKIMEFGKQIFNIELDKKNDTDFSIAGHTGKMISRGIMAGITGEPGDLIIMDDVIKNREEAYSQTYRDKVWNEYLFSINTRLSANGFVILIMTRWHEDDIAGRLLEKFPDKCIEINIPLEAEENDILGRKPGDSLFPEIGKDNEWLKEFKKVYMNKNGKSAWAAMMQGKPSSVEGAMLKRSWWGWYDKAPEQFGRIVMSVDATFKESDTSDFVAISVWGKINSDIYLLDFQNERMDFPKTVEAIRNMSKKWPCNCTYIEDKANGSAIISVLRHEIGGIVPVRPKESKIARVSAVSGYIEAGNVYLPKDKTFTCATSSVSVYDFVDQCSSFPAGSHDDMTDSMSQALNKLIYSYGEIPSKPHTKWEEMTEDEQIDYEIEKMTGGMDVSICNWRNC